MKKMLVYLINQYSVNRIAYKNLKAVLASPKTAFFFIQLIFVRKKLLFLNINP